MILSRIFGYGLILSLGANAVLYGLWQHAEGRRHKLASELGKQAVKAQIDARETERRHALAQAEIADKYEQDKRDAQSEQEALVAGLRAGTVRLRNLWQGCQATSRLSGAVASAAEPDAAARDREESAGRIVRAARDADDLIRRLQEVIREDRR